MLGKRDCCLIQLSSSHTVLFANTILGIKRKKQFYEQRQHDSTRSNCEIFSAKKLKIKSSVVRFLAAKCSHFSWKLIKDKKKSINFAGETVVFQKNTRCPKINSFFLHKIGKPKPNQTKRTTTHIFFI